MVDDPGEIEIRFPEYGDYATDRLMRDLNQFVSETNIRAEYFRAKIVEVADAGYTKDEADAKFSLTTHLHDSRYSQIGHNHDGVYSPIGHNHDGRYALIVHNHDGVYSPTGHTHDTRYYTKDEIFDLLASMQTLFDGKLALKANTSDVFSGSVFRDDKLPVRLREVNSRQLGSTFRLGIFRFSSPTMLSNTKWHFKTNYLMNDKMVMLEIKGYEYGAPKVIDARHACYPYSATNDVINKATQGTHVMNSYKSTDGFLCFSIDLASTYYVGGVLNVYEANPPSMGALEITANGYASSAQAY